MREQGLLPLGADSRDPVEQGGGCLFGAPVAVGPDGETVGLVPEALEEMHQRVVRREGEAGLAGLVELLAPGIPVGPLGDRHHRQVVHAELLHHLHGRGKLSLAAVDQHKVGPCSRGPVGVLAHRPLEPSLQHLPHHGEIVAAEFRRVLLLPDIELAVGVPNEPLLACDDHAADGVAALDVRVVVDLDAARRLPEVEQLLEGFEQIALAAGLGHLPRQRLGGVPQRHRDQVAALAAGGLADGDLALGAGRQRLGNEPRLLRQDAHQDIRGAGLVVVELADEGGHDLLRPVVPVVAREEGLVAVVRAVAHEERLHATAPALLVDGEDIGVQAARQVDVLVRLDAGQGPDAVAPERGLLVFEGLGGGVHAFGELVLDFVGLAGQEPGREADLVGVFGLADPPDAGRGAALDLVLQARPAAGGEHRIRAGAQHEGAGEGRDGPVDRPGGGEGAEIVGFAFARAAVLGELRPVVVAGQHDVREALVVAQQDVEARLQLLDEVGFEQQRFDFGAGGDDLHRPGLGDHEDQPGVERPDPCVVGDPPVERLRLADVKHLALAIEHSVDPRLGGEALGGLPDHRQTASEIRVRAVVFVLFHRRKGPAIWLREFNCLIVLQLVPFSTPGEGGMAESAPPIPAGGIPRSLWITPWINPPLRITNRSFPPE